MLESMEMELQEIKLHNIGARPINVNVLLSLII